MTLGRRLGDEPLRPPQRPVKCIKWLVSCCLLLCPCRPGAALSEKPPVKLVATIRMSQIKGHQADLSADSLAKAVSTEKIPGISGHFDRLGLDLKGDRLFVTPEDNHTVEVYNLARRNLKQLLCSRELGGVRTLPSPLCPEPGSFEPYYIAAMAVCTPMRGSDGAMYLRCLWPGAFDATGSERVPDGT